MERATDRSRARFEAARSLLVALRDRLVEAGSERATELRSLCDLLDARVFRVAVVATTSTGKSTFINALLGLELMPVADEPKTALPVRARPIARTESPRLEIHYRDGRPPEVAPIDLGDAAPTRERLDALMTRDQALEIERVLLRVPAEAFREGAGHALPEVELIDTPGPTSAGLTDHREQALRAIDEAHAVIYLLDFKKPLQRSDVELLEQIREIWRRQGRLDRAHRKLFFALNRSDDQSRRNKLTPDDRAEQETRALRELMEAPALRPVVPISALAAMYARLSIRGALLDEDDAFEHERIYSALAFRARRSGRDDLLSLTDRDDFLLRASNLEAFEASVYDFLVASALDEIAADALDSALSILQQEHQNARRQLGLWAQEGSDVASKIDQARRALRQLEGRFRERRGAWARDARGEARALIAARVGAFRAALRPDASSAAAPWGPLWTDLRALQARLGQAGRERFTSQERARAHQRALAVAVAGALSPHQARLAVELQEAMRSLARRQNRAHRDAVQAATGEVEAALDREIGGAAAFPDESIEIPAAPELAPLQLGEIGLSRSTGRGRSRRRPWFLRWMARPPRAGGSVYAVDALEVLDGLRASYDRALAAWVDEATERYVAGFIDPVGRHYEANEGRYLSAIEHALAQHERDRGRLADERERVAALERWRDETASWSERGRTLRSHTATDR